MPPYDSEITGADLIETRDASTAEIVRPIAATDGELLLRFVRHRDEGAFAELVDTHAALVWAVCRQVLRNEADIEDAFQATFLILAKRAHTIRASDSAAGWLYRVAHRTAIALWRQERRRSEEPLADHEPIDSDVTDPLAALHTQHVTAVLVEELRALPEHYQSPLVLCYLEGQSRSAAAAALDCTTAAIKGRLARGRRMLRGRLARRGVALSVAAAAAATAVVSAKSAVASMSLAGTSLSSATASAASSFVSNGGATVAPQVSSLAQQGVSAMFYASLVKPAVCSAIAVVAIGVATALAVDDAPLQPVPQSGYVLDTNGAVSPGDALQLQFTPSPSSPPTPANTHPNSSPPANRASIGLPEREPRAEDQSSTLSVGSAVLSVSGDWQQVDAPQFSGEPIQPTPYIPPARYYTAPPQPAQQPPRLYQNATADTDSPSIEQLKLERGSWEARAEGLEAKAAAKMQQFEHWKSVGAESPESVNLLELTSGSEARAEAMLLRADALMAKAKVLEIEQQIKQREERTQFVPSHPIIPPTPAAPPQSFDSPRSTATPNGYPYSVPRESSSDLPQSSILWQPSIDVALKIADKRNKMVLVHFSSPSSAPCQRFTEMVARSDLIAKNIAESYVPVNINVSDDPLNVQRFGIDRVPTVVVMRPDTGSPLEQFIPPATSEEYVKKLRELAEEFQATLPASSDDAIRPSRPRDTTDEALSVSPDANPKIQQLEQEKAALEARIRELEQQGRERSDLEPVPDPGPPQ